jgi:nucleoside-diphosphate-sugar epimerase
VARLAELEPSASILATDRSFRHPPANVRVEQVVADLADRAAVLKLCSHPFDLVFHLASVPGAAAERSADAGRAVNRDGALLLIDAVARQSEGMRPPRFVFASSIAVYGAQLGGPITEDAPARPDMSYGAHKLMVEIELADRTRRGELLGCSLRLPGIVARPLAESGHGSSFMSRIFHAVVRGEAYTCPASPAARCWWMSRSRVVGNLIHASRLEPDLLCARSVWQPPVLVATIGDVVEELAVRYGRDAVKAISYEPDPIIEQLFGSMPALSAEPAERAGFGRDGTIAEFVEAVVSQI